jgi:hypothetical protein
VFPKISGDVSDGDANLPKTTFCDKMELLYILLPMSKITLRSTDLND